MLSMLLMKKMAKKKNEYKVSDEDLLLIDL